MTTPAISVSNLTLQSQTGFSQSQACSGSLGSLVSQGTFVNLRKSESRPASVNHPRIHGSLWRAPGAWNHSRIVDNPNPNGTLTLWQTRPGTGCVRGSCFRYYNGFGWTSTGSGLPAFPSYLEGRAVSRALLKLKHQDVNLAVAFAERKQTKELFAHSAKRIAKQVTHFKGKNPKDWAQVVKGNWKNTPNSWLELQYGWKPLISDIEGSLNALASRESGGQNPYYRRVKGIAGETITTNWRKASNVSPFFGFDVTDKYLHICKVSLYYQLRNPRLATLASLGLTNPFEVAWEKLKYSFVIDWFLPVGKWLSALDADFGWDFRSGTVTRFSRGGSTSRFTVTGFVPSWPGGADFSGSPYKSDGFNMVRSVYSSAPWAGIPRFKNPLSSQHIANAMSLLTQAFRR